MSEPVAVGVGECRCPGRPHPDGDVVYLRPVLGLAAGIAVQKLVVEANSAPERLGAAELTGVLAEAYLLHGVEAWNLVTAAGVGLPVTAATIRSQLLDDFSRAEAVADAADDLYMGPVLAPLLKKAAPSSPTTSTNGSTSVTLNGKSKGRKRSRPSSTTTIPMDDTATTSA